MPAGDDHSEAREPPSSIGGILRSIGPGLIVAGSIVGSGELIATTATGAEAGFWLLWLILIGCVIKVFTQVELGRYAVTSRQTTLAALNTIPGPTILRAKWIVWYWFAMFLVIIGQQGGIVGGVGQALAISAPLTDDGRRYNEIVDAETQLQVNERYLALIVDHRGELSASDVETADEIKARIAEAQTRLEQLGKKPNSIDDRIWAFVLTVMTAILLVVGRYRLVQTLATVLVGLFTVVTIVNLVMLQANETLAVTTEELVNGLSFQLPPPSDAAKGTGSPLATALATFGIIGVGASELVAYPYWCLEKGYARFTGPADRSQAWTDRANGWLNVMRWDAWTSMVVYTFATVAFYLVGAATLGRFHLEPEGTELVRTLAVMYEPVFGAYAAVLFLFGAFAVLYSTFFVANAGNARMVSDALRVLGLGVKTEKQRQLLMRVFCGVFPFLGLGVYLLYQAPKVLVLASGVMQALMLPMLAGAALYFRYRRSDPRVRPGRTWDSFLWISAIGMLIAGGALAYIKLTG